MNKSRIALFYSGRIEYSICNLRCCFFLSMERLVIIRSFFLVACLQYGFIATLPISSASHKLQSAVSCCLTHSVRLIYLSESEKNGHLPSRQKANTRAAPLPREFGER
jgi:hypothetical protein